MKRYKIIILISCVFGLTITFNAQSQIGSTEAASKKNIDAIEIQQLTNSEYKSAAELWQTEVQNNAQNEIAWLNLYKSTRYAAISNQTKKISKENQKELTQILEKMNAALPNSFAFQYASYLHGNKSDESFSHLKAAYNIRPNEVELVDDMLCDALITQNGENVRKFAQLLSKQNIYNASEVEYNKNVLNSIEQNAVLLTSGNVDTYPLILMQQLQNFRTDVTVINMEWLNSKTYLSSICLALGIESGNNFSVEKILSGSKRPVYVSLTTSQDLIQRNVGKLYCTGLAMKYSKSSIENLTSLAYNWEFLFSKAQIQSSDLLNKNYLLPLLLLRDHYTNTGKPEQADETQNLILQISQRFALEKQIKKHLD